MSDPLTTSDDRTRTGEFYFRVSRQDGEAWHWQMRIEALGTGEWGTFDSMQEALWFIRQHLTVEEDAETDETLASDDSDLPLEEPGGENDGVNLVDAAR
jgi:hypothetical protein